MTKVIAIILFLGFGLTAASQQTATFVVSKDTSSQVKETLLRFKTIEELLSLPQVYTVISCSFIFSTKREIFKTEATWLSPQITTFIRNAKQGDALTIDNIIVSKDGKRSKLMSKTFKF